MALRQHEPHRRRDRGMAAGGVERLHGKCGVVPQAQGMACRVLRIGPPGTCIEEQAAVMGAHGPDFLVERGGHGLRSGAHHRSGWAQAARKRGINALLPEHPRQCLHGRGGLACFQRCAVGGGRWRAGQQDLYGRRAWRCTQGIRQPEHGALTAQRGRRTNGFTRYQPDPGCPQAAASTASQHERQHRGQDAPRDGSRLAAQRQGSRLNTRRAAWSVVHVASRSGSARRRVAVEAVVGQATVATVEGPHAARGVGPQDSGGGSMPRTGPR